MKRNLKEIFGNYKKIKQGAKYTIHLAVTGKEVNEN